MASKNTMSDRNLVSKGTSSDDTPTPGFVLKELVSTRRMYLDDWIDSTWAGPQKCKDLVWRCTAATASGHQDHALRCSYVRTGLHCQS